MDLKEWNALQIDAALSELNRYYFWRHYGRNPLNNDELVLYFIEAGSKQWRADNESLGEGKQDNR